MSGGDIVRGIVAVGLVAGAAVECLEFINSGNSRVATSSLVKMVLFLGGLIALGWTAP